MTTTTLSSLAHLSNAALLAEVKALAKQERTATAQLIASMAELDARRLYLRSGVDAASRRSDKTPSPASTSPRPARAPAPGSRHISAAVKREVWARDGGQCAFTGTNGRCTETGFLEFHHVVPYAAGGLAVTDNLQLRCRAHNAYEAEQYFGPRRSSLRPEGAGPLLWTHRDSVRTESS